MNKLMQEILFALVFLQENRMVHGDLRPSLIGVPLSPNGNFRLLDRLGIPASPEQVQKMNIDSGKDLYTSPAIFRGVCQDRKQIRHNPFKSDMFSFGLILLEAGILESVQSVFDFEEGIISIDLLVELVERFIDTYPNEYPLQETLMVMLEFSEKLRQEPMKMLETMRELQEADEGEGKSANSFSHANADLLMNKVRITDSGYEFNEADQMLVSNFSRVFNRSRQSAVRNEDISGEEMEKSLLEMMKQRQSRVVERNRDHRPDQEQEKKPEPGLSDSFEQHERRAKEIEVDSLETSHFRQRKRTRPQPE